VLPTILSRCQVVTFRRVPEAEAEAMVCERSGAAPADARIALSACGGSIYRAAEFLRSSQRRSARLEVLAAIEDIANRDDMEVLESVKALLVTLKAPIDSVKAEQETARLAAKDYLAKGAQARLEQQHKRELSNRERETVGEALDCIRSWLRDVLLVRSGCAEPARNHDHLHFIQLSAERVDEPRLVAALQAVDRAQEQIQYNVSVQLALESLLFTVRDQLR